MDSDNLSAVPTEAKDSTRTDSEGSTRTEAKDSTRTEAKDSTRTEAKNSAQSEAEDNTRTEAKDKARTEATDTARTETKDSTCTSAKDSTRTDLKDSTLTEAKQMEDEPSASLIIVIKETQESTASGGHLSVDDTQGNTSVQNTKDNVGQDDNDDNDHAKVENASGNNDKDEPEKLLRKDSDLEIMSVTADVAQTVQMWEAEDTLQCTFCKQVFVEQGSYLLHLLTHKDMTCKEHLPLHKTKLCYYNSRYQCYNCKLKTKHRVVFREHVRHHVLKLPYKCSVCLLDLNSIDAFQNHLSQKVCSATQKNLVVKRTDIVRQVMKMLGPNAPATEHYYAVGKSSGTGKTGASSTRSDDTSSPSSTPPLTASVTQLVSASNAATSTSSFIKVTRPVLTLVSESTICPTSQSTTTTASITESRVQTNQDSSVELAEQIEHKQRLDPQLDSSAEDGVLYIAESPKDASVQKQTQEKLTLETESATLCESPARKNGSTQDNIDETDVQKDKTIDEDAGMSVSSESQTTQTLVGQDRWTPVIIGCSSVQKSDDPSQPSVPTTEIIGGTAPSDVGTSKPAVEDEDGIRVIDFTKSSSSSDALTKSTERSESSSSVGLSADHPILINDDDLHNATKGTQNKIKIEKKPNGIVLRLFRDVEGVMEDLSQLGLEIRGNCLFCYRCEKLFANMTEFVPHVSTEIHKIFFFYAGQCPVCKLDSDVPGGVPCKLARILCRVLAAVFRNQAQSNVGAVQSKDENAATSAPKATVSPAREPLQIPVLPLQGSPTLQRMDTPTSPVVNPQQLQQSPQKFLIVNASPQQISPRLPAASSSRCIILQNQVIPVSAPQTVLTGQVNSPGILTGTVNQKGILTGSVNQQGVLTGPVNPSAVLVPVQQRGNMVGVNQTSQILTAPLVLAPGTQLIAQGQKSPRVIQGMPGQQQGGLTSLLTSSSLPHSHQASGIASVVVQQAPIVSPTSQLVTMVTPSTKVIVPSAITTLPVVTTSAPTANPTASTTVTMAISKASPMAAKLPAGDVTVLTYKHTVSSVVVTTASISSVTTSTSTAASSVVTAANLIDTSVSKTTNTVESTDVSAAVGQDPTQPDSDTSTSSKFQNQAVGVNKHSSKTDEISGAPPDLSNQNESSGIASVSRMLETSRHPDVAPLDSEASADPSVGERSSNQTPVSVNMPSGAELNEVATGNGPVNLVNGGESVASEELMECAGEDQAESVDQSDTGSSISETISSTVNGSPRNLTEVKPAPKKKPPGQRMYVGKFILKDGVYKCVKCNVSTVSQNAFKLHVSKHVHFRRRPGGVGSSHYCTHCPEHIKYNKIGHCPVLKQTMKMLFELGSKHSSWRLKISDGPMEEVRAPKKSQSEDKSKSAGQNLISSLEPSVFLSTEAASQYPRAIAPKVSVAEITSPGNKSGQQEEQESVQAAYQGQSLEEDRSDKMAYPTRTDSSEGQVHVDRTETARVKTAVEEHEEDESCQRITPYTRRVRPDGDSSILAKSLDVAKLGTSQSSPNFLVKCAFQDCDYKTTDETSFQLHNLTKHATEKVFTCAYCPKSFADLDGLIQHQDDHKGWVYKCSFHSCKFGARKIADYQYHLREQHSNEYRFNCCFCTKVATAIEDILSHTELHVRTVTKCPYCEKASTDKKDVQLHIAVQHVDKPKKVIISTQIIKNLEDLEELHRQESEAAAAAMQTEAPQVPMDPEPAPHEATEMPELLQPLTEQQEDTSPEDSEMAEVLPSGMEMETHEDRELSSPESPANVDQESLGEEPYEGYEPKKCEKCTFMATDEVMMDDHLALHEQSQSKELRFYCRQCPFSSDEVLDYRIHMQHHTGPQTLRVYICAHCDYSSMQMSKIEDHLMDVHPEDPFKFEVSQEKLEHLQLMKACEFCGEYVLSVSDNHMADHIQSYHPPAVEKVDKKPEKSAATATAGGVVIESFHCDMCPYSAPSDEDLTLHLKITHRVERSEREAAIKSTTQDILSASERIVNAVQSSRKKQALYECDLCSYKTANKKIFIDHHRQHAEGGTMDMYKCEFCPYQSAKYKNLTHHQKIHARQVEEGYKCPYCYYVHGLKSRVSWHISAYHPGREKNIVEITKGNPVPALIDDSAPAKESQSQVPVKKPPAAKKSTTKPAVNQPTVHQSSSTQATSKVYKQSSQVNFEYQGPYATTSAPAASGQQSTSPNKPRPSALPQYLEDDSLRDFERNLPKDMVFSHPVFCPLCSYSNRVRVNMLRHLKTHVKPKSAPEGPSTSQQTSGPVSVEISDPVDDSSLSQIPKDFLSFFKRSTELTVFQCRLCSYVHVNGADMVRHFLCEHAVLACGLCEEHAISMTRMREHYSAAHGSASLDVYLKRGSDIHKLKAVHIAKIDEMDKMTMLEEDTEVATASDEEEEEVINEDTSAHIDSETRAVTKHCTKVMVGNHLRYKCKMCDYLSSLQMIKRHVLSVHMKFFPFRCKYCKTTSRERYHLQVHMKKVHPGRPVVMNRVKFDPEKHGRIVKTACLSSRKRKRDDDSSSLGNDGSESEHSQSQDRSSMERMTPSESVSSMESTAHRGRSTPTVPTTAIKQEPGEPPVPESANRRRSASDLPRVHDLREHTEPPRPLIAGQQDPVPATADGDKIKPRKKYCCAYCDYVSMYLKQDIQRHILLKHLLIHVFMCKKCKFATNNKKQVEQHKKQNKNHAYRDWTEIKDKIVEIHQEDMEAVFGFPEGQLTEIQQQLDKIPGLYQFVNTSPAKGASTPQSKTSTLSEPSTPSSSRVSSDVGQDTSSLSVNTSDYSQFTEFTRNAGLLSPTGSLTQDRKHNSMALAAVKIQKKASEIKLPKMELFCCSYCDYSSKYGRGDVKKHIMFKHFMNKKYTCEYCGFSTWTEHIIKSHSETSHPNQPPNVYNFELEHECIVPIRTTSDHHMMMGVKAPPNSPIELQKNTLFQCKLCNVEGPNIVKIKIHVVVKHWNMKPFQCPICGDQRWKKQTVQDHIAREHPGSTEQGVATTTKKATELANLVKRRIVFSSQRAGKSVITATAQGETSRKCCACDYVAADQEDLNSHMSSHSVFSCIYCPFQALCKGDVQSHITKDHPEYPVRIKTSMPSTAPNDGNGASGAKKPRPAQFTQPRKKLMIGQKLSISQKLPVAQKLPLAQKAVLVARKKFDRLYQCKECGHQVENYKNIIEHICKHINYFRFHCLHCTQRTLRGYTMSNHMEQHHPDTDGLYKVHKDEELEEKLKDGYIIVHKTSKNKDCPASCPLCGKRCARLSTLREHIMREMNYRPFLCPICDYSDCTGGRVNFHMRLHQGLSGSYKMKIDNQLAAEVQKLIDEAKKREDEGRQGDKPVSLTPTKPTTSAASRFPKINLKPSPSPSTPQSRPPSVTSISSTSAANSSRETSLEPATTASTASEENETPKAHRCHLCPYSTDVEKLYKTHLLRTHGKKRWKCHYCDCQTVYRSTLIKHMKDTHRQLPMKLIQLLPAPKTPMKHIPDLQVVKTPGAFGVAEPQLPGLVPEGSPVTIKIEKAPSKSTPVKSHPKAQPKAPLPPNVQILGPSDDGRYLCSACPYSTTQRKLIGMHLNNHREPDLECHYCKKIYRVSYRLRRHSRVRHQNLPIIWKNLTSGDMHSVPWNSVGATGAFTSDPGENPQTLYCCHACSYTGETSDALFRHMQDVHGSAELLGDPGTSSSQNQSSNLSREDIEVLRCGVCSYSTYIAEELTEHAKTHLPQKPFHCQLCSYTCKLKTDGLRHAARKHPHQKPSVIIQNLETSTSDEPSPIKRPRIVVQDIMELDENDLRTFMKSRNVLRAHITESRTVEV